MEEISFDRKTELQIPCKFKVDISPIPTFCIVERGIYQSMQVKAKTIFVILSYLVL